MKGKNWYRSDALKWTVAGAKAVIRVPYLWMHKILFESQFCAMYEQNVSQKHVKPATNGGKVSPQAKLQYIIFNINGSMIFQKV